MRMTCQEANFLGDIRDLRLDINSVQEKRILCWEKISSMRSHGEKFWTCEHHVSTQKDAEVTALSTDVWSTSIFYVSLYGSLPFLPTRKGNYF